MTKEIYFSVDIETDGPCPGVNSMLSLGAVAMSEQQGVISEFYVNLLPLPGAQPNMLTQTQFWDRFPEMYAATQVDPQDPLVAMNQFRSWIHAQGGVPVAVAFPAGFDFSYLWYYMNRFGGECPFSFSCIDIKTMAWCLLGGNYRHATKRNWPHRWFSSLPHTHHALQDAQEQGDTFLRMLADLRQRDVIK